MVAVELDTVQNGYLEFLIRIRAIHNMCRPRTSWNPDFYLIFFLSLLISSKQDYKLTENKLQLSVSDLEIKILH